MEPWSDLSILPPPINTFYSGNCIDVSGLLCECKNISNILRKQSPLHQESALLSRFIYKYDKKFRNDIGYSNLKKVNTALRKYLKLNLLKDIENFIIAIPSKEDNYLPTRQMLEYVLIRIITFSKIMLRICVCSKKSAIFYMDRVKRGDSHWMSLMPYALLCRVWSIGCVLLQNSCGWYSHLYQFLDKLQLKGLEFLPERYKLPLTLQDFLDLKNLDSFGRTQWTHRKYIDIDPTLIEADDTDAFDNILNYVNEINKEEYASEEFQIPATVASKVLDVTPVHFKSIDQGEIISRDMLKDLCNIQFDQKDNSSYVHKVEAVTNTKSLTQFIDQEEEFRNSNNYQSLTSHLSFMQWQALKNSLSKLKDPLVNNRKIERKFQKIWKEKCLEYM